MNPALTTAADTMHEYEGIMAQEKLKHLSEFKYEHLYQNVYNGF